MSAFRTNAGPPIETKRCLCTSLAYGDFPGVARLYSDHRVRRFLGGVADETSSRDRFETLCSTSHGPIWAVRVKAAAEFIGAGADGGGKPRGSCPEDDDIRFVVPSNGLGLRGAGRRGAKHSCANADCGTALDKIATIELLFVDCRY